MARSPIEKIEMLESIESDIIQCLHSAGTALTELGKDKSSLKAAENHTSQFLKHLNQVEKKLSDQISYLTQVSTGQPHEGSGYGSAKVLQMAWHRIYHVKSRVRELEETKHKHFQSSRRPTNGIGPAPGAAGASVGAPASSQPPQQ